MLILTYWQQFLFYIIILLWFLGEQGTVFKSVPTGTKTQRRKQYKERERYIGAYATVRYAGLSNDNIPVPNPVTTYVGREASEFN